MPRAKGNATVPNDPPPDPDTPHKDPLIGDLIDTEEDSDYALGPNELGFYTFFIKGVHNPSSRNCAIFVRYVNSSELHL